MAASRRLLGISLVLLVVFGYVQSACVNGTPDGVVGAGEECDDGNNVNTDGCTNACTIPFFQTKWDDSLAAFRLTVKDTGLKGVIQCSSIFAASTLNLLGQNPVCRTVTDKVFLIQLGTNADSNALDFTPLTIGGLEHFPGSTAGDATITMQEPTDPVTPVVVIESSNVIPSCLAQIGGTFTIDATGTYGSGGLAAIPTWTLVDSTNTAISTILNNANTAASLTLTIPANALAVGVNYKIQLGARNWYQVARGLTPNAESTEVVEVVLQTGDSVLLRSSGGHTVKAFSSVPLNLAIDVSNPCDVEVNATTFLWNRQGGIYLNLANTIQTANTNRLHLAPIQASVNLGETRSVYLRATAGINGNPSSVGHVLRTVSISNNVGLNAAVSPYYIQASYLSAIHLSASASSPFNANDEFTYAWDCYAATNVNGGCPVLQQLGTDAEIVVPSAGLAPGEYVFEVTVSAGALSGKAQSTVVVSFDTQIPEVSVIPLAQENAPAGTAGLINVHKEQVFTTFVAPALGDYSYQWSITTDAWAPAYYNDIVTPQTQGWNSPTLRIGANVLRSNAAYTVSVIVTNNSNGKSSVNHIAVNAVPNVHAGTCELSTVDAVTRRFAIRCTGFEPGSPGPLFYDYFYNSALGEGQLGTPLDLDNSKEFVVPAHATAVGVHVYDAFGTSAGWVDNVVITAPALTIPEAVANIKSALAINDLSQLVAALSDAKFTLEATLEKDEEWVDAQVLAIRTILDKYVVYGPNVDYDGATVRLNLLAGTTLTATNITAELALEIVEFVASTLEAACTYPTPSGCVYSRSFIQAVTSVLENVLPQVNFTETSGETVRDLLDTVSAALLAQPQLGYGNGDSFVGTNSGVTFSVFRGSLGSFPRFIHNQTVGLAAFELPEELFAKLEANGVTALQGVFSQLPVNYFSYLANVTDTIYAPVTDLTLYDQDGNQVHVTLDSESILINLPSVSLRRLNGTAGFLEPNARIAFYNVTSGTWDTEGVTYLSLYPANERINPTFRGQTSHLTSFVPFSVGGVVPPSTATSGTDGPLNYTPPFRVTAFLIILALVGALLIFAVLVLVSRRTTRRLKWVPGHVEVPRSGSRNVDPLATRDLGYDSVDEDGSENASEASIRLFKPFQKNGVVIYEPVNTDPVDLESGIHQQYTHRTGSRSVSEYSGRSRSGSQYSGSQYSGRSRSRSVSRSPSRSRSRSVSRSRSPSPHSGSDYSRRSGSRSGSQYSGSNRSRSGSQYSGSNLSNRSGSQYSGSDRSNRSGSRSNSARSDSN